MVADKKRTIPKAEYDKNRKKADEVNQDLRAKIAKEKGKAAIKGKDVDDIKPIAKGGSPTDLKNKRLIPAKANKQKGSK
jgi:hypothetical protein